jgi:cytochrome P450
MLQTMNLLCLPSTDPTALGRRLGAAAKKNAIVHEPSLGLPMLLRSQHIGPALRDTESFSNRMFQAGVLKGGLASLAGEEHTRMRRIYNLFFTPRALARYEESIVRPTVTDMVGRLKEKEHVDLLDDFCVAVPKHIISRLFGLPLEHLDKNDARVRTMFRGIIQIGNPLAATAADQALSDTLQDLAPLIDEEMATPSHRLLGEIIRVLKEEGMASLEICQQIVISLLLGGYETTIWLFANALHALLAHPEVLSQVRQAPESISGAIEESMRWCPSTVGTVRLVEKKVSLPDLELEPGTVVYLAATTGHYDENQYPEPERYDIKRKVTPMIFGGGPHFCVGAQLARMEARIALSELIANHPALRLDPVEPPIFTYGVRESVAHGPDRLPAFLY